MSTTSQILDSLNEFYRDADPVGVPDDMHHVAQELWVCGLDIITVTDAELDTLAAGDFLDDDSIYTVSYDNSQDPSRYRVSIHYGGDSGHPAQMVDAWEGRKGEVEGDFSGNGWTIIGLDEQENPSYAHRIHGQGPIALFAR